MSNINWQLGVTFSDKVNEYVPLFYDIRTGVRPENDDYRFEIYDPNRYGTKENIVFWSVELIMFYKKNMTGRLHFKTVEDAQYFAENFPIKEKECNK